VGVATSADWMKWEASLYGAPQHEISEVYEYASNLTFVGNLKGKLLLAQTTDDDLDETMILIEALTDAVKPYDLIILPKGGHSLTERHPTYYHDARIRYLVEHLKPELGPEK
jgi:dipeptidyl aminopeptidase/acylaminoacyl peptidase